MYIILRIQKFSLRPQNFKEEFCRYSHKGGLINYVRLVTKGGGGGGESKVSYLILK